ncbi:MAG TPA: ATP-binding protein [Cytophagaceae bacterium]|jgi:AAA+ ATPase superfamily predicted ATPase|nr:ATP-binding protein [Cytophagaceae bacterium]
MRIPFIYGKIATGQDFTNRIKETKKLLSNFSSLTNTILISPRRWGKSSLVMGAAAKMAVKDKKVKFCFIDLYNVKSEEEFYQLLSQEVLKVTSGKMEEAINSTKKFLSQFIPKLSFGSDALQELTLGLNWSEVSKQPDEILDLAEKLAKEKKMRIIICIDEFQNIASFNNPLAFQKKLRAHWQKHQSTSYCLYGSRRHMMMEVFASTSMPFYKFGEIIMLEKITVTDWIPFLRNRFTQTGKQIDPDTAAYLAELVDCHSYYVQQLAQQSWFRTTKKCTKKIVAEAHDELLRQMSLLFQTQTDGLTSTQTNFLKALLEKVTQPSSKENLLKYNLGTSANVIRIKEALLNKEIIDTQEERIYFMDPVYECWLRKYYFKLPDSKNKVSDKIKNS